MDPIRQASVGWLFKKRFRFWSPSTTAGLFAPRLISNFLSSQGLLRTRVYANLPKSGIFKIAAELIILPRPEPSVDFRLADGCLLYESRDFTKSPRFISRAYGWYRKISFSHHHPTSRTVRFIGGAFIYRA